MSLRTPADFSPKLRNRIKERLNDVRTKLTGVVTSQWAINELFAPEEENIARKYAEIEGAKLHRAWIEERSRSGKMEKDDDKRLFLPHAIDIFCHVRQVDPVVAVLDLGCRRELISIEQYHRLRRKLGIDETDYGIDLLRAIEVADLVVDEYRCLGIWKG